MERQFRSHRANPELASRKSSEKRLFSNTELVMGLSAAIAIGLAWRNHQANQRRIAESEQPTVLKTRRKKLGLANTLALSALSLSALLFSAGDSSARHLPDNNQTVQETDKSNSDEIDVANVLTLKTPFILNVAQATMTPVVEPTFEPTLQPTGTPRLAVTEAVEANVNSELPIKVEMHSCPSGWPLEHGVITQGPRGVTSHYRLYPSERAIDIAADTGSAVFATFDGQVVSVNLVETNNYGIYVDVKGECNSKPFTVRYAHLSAVSEGVAAGVEVANRKEIGAVGDTGGNSRGAHLHYAFFGDLEMNEPNIPITIMSFECDSERDCGVIW